MSQDTHSHPPCLLQRPVPCLSTSNQQCSEYAKRTHESTASEVGKYVGRSIRWRIFSTELGEDSRDSKVIYIMSSHVDVRPIVAKASQTGNDKTWIVRKECLGIEIERLEDTGPKWLDEDVRMVEDGLEEGESVGGI